MKYRHTDGTEYEVADLIRTITNAASLTSKQNPSLRNRFLAASALLARHAVEHAALERIAEFTDRGASEHLESCGSYALFDEPNSVQIARTALRGEEASGG